MLSQITIAVLDKLWVQAALNHPIDRSGGGGALGRGWVDQAKHFVLRGGSLELPDEPGQGDVVLVADLFELGH